MARAEDHQVAEAAEGYQETVADYLARAREEYGQDLRSVSDALRIRFVYLQAIEDGRYRDLPGSTYAVGFVRTYADYLGLDSEEIVRRFKEEMGGLDRRQRLVFQVPKPEGRVPGGAIILISLLLVALAYGGWYAFQGEQNIMEMISGGEEGTVVEETPPPEEEVPAQEAGTSEAPSETEPAPALESAPAQEPEADETAAGEAAPETEQEPAPALEVEVAAPAEPEPAAETETETETETAAALPEEAAEIQPPLEEEESMAESAAEGALEQPGEEIAAALPAAPPAAPQESDASGDVFGAPPEDPVRIVIEAANDSWVQVFDQNDQLLIARVLRAGDRYRVPQQEGLSMLTGNAGGLEVRVDGAAVPSLGPFGQVVRNIALDPVLLLNGSAVGAASNPQ